MYGVPYHSGERCLLWTRLTNAYDRIGGSDAALSGFMLAGVPAKGNASMKTGDGSGRCSPHSRVSQIRQYADTNGWPNNGSWERNGSIDGITGKEALSC